MRKSALLAVQNGYPCGQDYDIDGLYLITRISIAEHLVSVRGTNDYRCYLLLV